MNSPPDPAGRPQHDNEVPVGDWTRLLLNRWAILAAGALFGALLGFAVGARTPPVYAATATVLLSPPPDPAGVFTVPGMRAVVISQSISSKLAEELRATGRYDGGAPEILAALSIEQVLNTQLFHVTVRLHDPQLAATAATRASELAVTFMSGLWRELLAEKRTQLDQQMEEARLAIVEVERQLLGTPRPASMPSSSQPARGLSPATELEMQRRVYIETAARLAQSRIELAGAGAPLRLIDAAAVPAAPLPAGRRRTIALGLLAGLILAACLVIAREWRVAPAVGPRTARE